MLLDSILGVSLLFASASADGEWDSVYLSEASFVQPAYPSELESDGSLIPARAAELRVLSGRAILAAGSGSQIVRPRNELVRIDDRAHLELPARSSARVVWPGRGSLLVHGPASIEWKAPPGKRDEALEWRIHFAARAYAEVRRGRVLFFSAFQWELELQACALEFRSRPNESIDVRLQAGSGLSAHWMGASHMARPPIYLVPGRDVHLGPVEEIPVAPDRARSAQPWPSIEWPWPVLRRRWVLREGPLGPEPAAQEVPRFITGEPMAPRASLQPTASRPRVTTLEPVQSQPAPVEEPLRPQSSPGPQTQPLEPIHQPVEEVRSEPRVPAATKPEVPGPSSALPPEPSSSPLEEPVSPSGPSLPPELPVVGEPASSEPKPAAEPLEPAESTQPAEPLESTDMPAVTRESVESADSIQAAPAAEPTQHEPTTAPESEVPASPAEDSAGELPPSSEPAEPGPRPEVESAPEHDATLWRGLAADEVRPLDQFRIEVHPGLEVLELLGARYRLSLSPTAERGAWVFGEDQDVRLSSGAVVIVTRSGRVVSHYGEVTFEPKLESEKTTSPD